MSSVNLSSIIAIFLMIEDNTFLNFVVGKINDPKNKMYSAMPGALEAFGYQQVKWSSEVEFRRGIFTIDKKMEEKMRFCELIFPVDWDSPRHVSDSYM